MLFDLVVNILDVANIFKVLFDKWVPVIVKILK